MIAIPWIIGRLANLWWNLWELYLNIVGIDLLRNTLGPIIYKFQEAISSLISDLWELNAWATDVSIAIRDILSWDTILDKIILTLFGGKRPGDWFWDMAWYWLDLYFPWLRDPELTIWGWLEWRVRALIPIDFVKPWEVWDLIVDRIRELIPDIPDIGAIATEKVREWIDAHLMAWLEDRAVDIAKMAGRILVRLW